MTTLVVAGLLVLAVGMSALGPEIVAFAARPDYDEAADVLPIIAFASASQGLYVMFVAAVFLMKRTERLAPVTFAAAILYVALNVALLPIFGIMGGHGRRRCLCLLRRGDLSARAPTRPTPDRHVDPRAPGGGRVAVVLLARVIPGPSPAAGAFHLLLAVGYAAAVAFVCRGPLFAVVHSGAGPGAQGGRERTTPGRPIASWRVR